MSNFKQYDEATAKFQRGLRIKTLPLFSFDFHHEYVKDLKNTFVSKQTNSRPFFWC